MVKVVWGNAQCLHIKTLGDFDIFAEMNLYWKKQSGLINYINCCSTLSLSETELLPEVIIDNLWQDQESMIQKHAAHPNFQAQKIDKKFLPTDADESKYFCITFANGYYCFETGELVVLDFVNLKN